MQRKAILLFPPNWTACAYGPHLAMPLLAGMARGSGWQVETWDLSEEFYRTYASPPARHDIAAAAVKGDFCALDRLYFAWEDQLRALPSAGEDGATFGLFSGYGLERFRSLRLAEAAGLVRAGTVYTHFIADRILPRLLKVLPSLIGITIASQEQVIPAIELLQLVRRALPDAYLLLGGNIVTRLRGSSAFDVLSSLADQTVVFQGDLAFARVLEVVERLGVERARDQLPRVTANESIPYESWPVPDFSGIAFAQSIGTPVLSYVSTRGCYYGKCHFCAIPAGWSREGYGGSAPAGFVADQLIRMAMETGVPRVKFVDEAVPPNKVRPLARALRESGVTVEWEGYARLEPAWEDCGLLQEARASGLRKLYFGLEQAPTASREVFGKNDRGDPLRILHRCHEAGIAVHLFCMVGHPGTSREDAAATVHFLVENESLVDTADLVGFRLDRGTTVAGVRATPDGSDWAMSMPYEATEPGVLCAAEVGELEMVCQEALWEAVPRLLHPLYRIVGPWDTAENPPRMSGAGRACLVSSSSTV